MKSGDKLMSLKGSKFYISIAKVGLQRIENRLTSNEKQY